MNLAALIDLYRHMEWADAAVWSSVFACEGAKKDGALKGRLHHLHLVQRAFLRIWRAEQLDAPYPEFEDTEALFSWCRPYYEEAAGHLRSLNDRTLIEPMPLPWAARVAQRLGHAPQVTSIGDTALQVVMHSQYHRGQINARLRELGGEPPLVDYIAWVWLGRPAPNWPLV